jgi:hypothetical protein
MTNITCPICKTVLEIGGLKCFEDDCRFMRIAGVNQHLVRYQCSCCDVIFGSEEMLNLSSEALSKAYQSVYLSGHRENDATSYEEKLFFMLEPSKHGPYINWGAGTSSTCDKVKQQGYTLLNYDPGIPTSSAYLTKEQLANMRVDGIISNNVLDHLQDPIADLLFMKSLLKPGSSMIHASDGFRYETSYTKFHLFFLVGRSVNVISNIIGMKGEFLPEILKGSDIVQWTSCI